jgi:phosphonate transport system substrate-binding protein
LILLNACTLPTPAPVATGTEPPATVAPTLPGDGTAESATATDVPTVVPELGEEGNPILLALPPAQILEANVIANGQELAAMLEEQTGYRVVAVSPSSYTELIEALRTGNAHIGALPPYAIVKAYQQEAARAAYASTQNKSASYGAQFLARSDRFESFFDPNAGRNFKDPPDALMQFSGKKPCWTETDSLSGYRVPAGILGWYKIPIQEGAFLQSHYSVVRAIELGEVCDFGATYIDARTYPALKDQFPKLMDEIVVVWQVPPVIPYNGLFYSPTLPYNVTIKLTAAFQQIGLDSHGQTLLKSLYDIEAMIPVQDNFYTEFVRYITSSGADWDTLVH